MTSVSVGPDGVVKASTTSGPKPLTKEDIEKTWKEMKDLEAEIKQLKLDGGERAETRDVELKEAKRIAAESRTKVEAIKSKASAELRALSREHDVVRKMDLERFTEYQQRIAEDGRRIAELEKQVAALVSAKSTSNSSSAQRAPTSSSAEHAETLYQFLGRLGLSAHAATLEDEELDVELLRSMGRDVLVSNMAELGLATHEIARMSDALFAVVGVL